MSEQIIDAQEVEPSEAVQETPPPPVDQIDAVNEETLEPLQSAGLASIELLMDVMLKLSVELGRAQMTVRQVLDIQKGSVVELNRVAGEAVDVFVNERLIARGEVVVVDDKFGVRITELISPVKDGNGN